MFDALSGDLTDRLEMKAILEPSFPISILVSFFEPLRELSNSVALPRKLDGLLHKSDGAKIFEITGTWSGVFYGSAVMALISAIGAFGLRSAPLPKKAVSAEAVAATVASR